MIGMGSVPAWVWPNAGMLVAVGVYLWWRLVLGTTRPHSAGRRVGTVAGRRRALLGPAALIAQYALPISAQRILGWPGWLGYGAGHLPRHRHPAHRAGPDLVVVAASARAAASDRGRRSGPQTIVAAPRSPAVPAARAGRRDRGRGRRGDRDRRAVGGRRPGRPHRHDRDSRLPAAAVGMRIALVSDLHLGSVHGPGLLPVGRRPGQRAAPRPGAAGRRSDRWQRGRTRRGPAAAGRSALGRGDVLRHRQSRVLLRPGRLAGVHPQLGIRVLANEGVPVRGLLLAGCTTSPGRPSGRGPDMDAALATRPPGSR